MRKNIKQYYKEVDIAKGIGIILVVLGHAMPNMDGKVPSGMAGILSEVIYSFHMPLFFFLSGLLANSILMLNEIRGDLLLKRCKRLMAPYFFCGFLFILFKIITAKITGEGFSLSGLWKILIGINPYYHLWFLYVLFIYFVIAILFVRKKNIIFAVIISLIISIALLNYLPEGSSVLNIPVKVLRYGIYFFSGMYVGLNYESIKKLLNFKYLVIAITLFSISNYVLLNNTNAIVDSIIGKVASFSGIFMTMALSSLLVKVTISKGLEMFGKYCMGIFIISGFIQPLIKKLLIGKLGFEYIWYVIVCTVSTVLLSLLVSFVIKKIKPLRILILGEE